MIREVIRDAFEEKVGSKYSHGIKVEYAYQKLDDLPSGFACPKERIRPWGTGHAVWAARSVIGNHSFAVINADDYYGKETFLRLIEFFSEDKPAKERINCAMIGFMLDQTLFCNCTSLMLGISLLYVGNILVKAPYICFYNVFQN